MTWLMMCLISRPQLKVLNSNIALVANFLKRCPSCLSNLVTHICDFTCDAHQSTYIEVIKTDTSKCEYEISHQHCNVTGQSVETSSALMRKSNGLGKKKKKKQLMYMEFR